MKNISSTYSTSKLRSTILVLLLALFCFGANAQNKLQKAPASNFTGNVWVTPLATDSVKHWSVAEVTFEKSARSNWHHHPDKQVLIITAGTGYLKQKGKPVQVLNKGDVVTILPGTLHWHGATPENSFTQMVINPNTLKGVVTWLQKVTDAEYVNR